MMAHFGEGVFVACPMSQARMAGAAFIGTVWPPASSKMNVVAAPAAAEAKAPAPAKTPRKAAAKKAAAAPAPAAEPVVDAEAVASKPRRVRAPKVAQPAGGKAAKGE